MCNFWDVKLGYLKKNFKQNADYVIEECEKCLTFVALFFYFQSTMIHILHIRQKKPFWLGLEMYVIILHPCGSLYVCEATASKTETPVRRCEKLRSQQFLDDGRLRLYYVIVGSYERKKNFGGRRKKNSNFFFMNFQSQVSIRSWLCYVNDLYDERLTLGIFFQQKYNLMYKIF